MRNLDILIIDVRAVAHSVKHSLGRHRLSNNEKPTFVIFGFLNRLLHIAKQVRPDIVVFAHDSKDSKRKEIFPGYKNRNFTNKKSPQMIELDELALPQMIELDEYVLPTLGFKNRFLVKGFEADDIIASLCKKYRSKNYITIATNDQDIYQCLHNNVRIFNLKRNEFYTKSSFCKEWNIKPETWATVKSLAGCTSDVVPGIIGVKEKTAIKYLKNQLKDTSKAYINIKNSNDIRKRNKKLVKLPFKGTPEFRIRPDHLSMKDLKKICKKYGIKSIARQEDQWRGILKFKGE